MKNSIINTEGEDPLQALEDFGAEWMEYFSGVQQLMTDYKRLKHRVAELEEANAGLAEAIGQLKKGDEWSSRVTYDNVVDQIASNEDAAQRDLARKLIEPLLKRAQVTQLRKDIKRRVKELNEDSSANIVIEQAELTVQGDYVENKGVENLFNAPIGQVINHVDKLE